MPRLAATCSAVSKLFNPSTVALTTLIGVAEPNDLDKISEIPANSITARTGPPATTPVPAEAGLNTTRPAP